MQKYKKTKWACDVPDPGPLYEKSKSELNKWVQRDGIAESERIKKTLEQIPVIRMFSTSDQSLSQLNIENSFFNSVQSYLQSLVSLNANIGNCYGLEVRKRDLFCLKPNAWLNDTIINLSFLLIQEKCLANNIELNIVSSHWFSQFVVSFLYLFV